VTSLAKLREFAREKPVAERCELCSAALGSQHSHLVEPATRKLLCACQPCSILFSVRGLTSKYARVPREGRFLSDFRMSDADWDELLIPINMAFFFHSSPERRVVAIYPGPAGATESLLSLEAWERIEEQNPRVKSMEPDVEALLVNRIAQAPEYYIAPIDQCYKLVGLIRASWRGFSGGTEVWERINEFFARLREDSHA
jgi:hypothetical protein